MKPIRGICIESVEVEGQKRPAFVFWISRAKQRLALGAFLAITALNLYALFHAKQLVNVTHTSEIFPEPLVILLTFTLAATFAFGSTRAFRGLRSPRASLTLTAEGVYLIYAGDNLFIPWGEIEEVSRIDISEHSSGKQHLVFRLRAPEEIPEFQKFLSVMAVNRLRFGRDIAYGMIYFEAKPHTIELATQYFFHHPEKRSEIGTETGLETIQTLMDQKWQQPERRYEREPVNDFFNPENHDELLNPELQEAIKAFEAVHSSANKRRLFEVLLETTFCLPTYEEEGTKIQIFAGKNDENEPILRAFSDPAALRRWEDEPGKVLVIEAQELFKLAIENNFVQIDINPAGPAGGSLSREEFTSLAQGVIPN